MMRLAIPLVMIGAALIVILTGRDTMTGWIFLALGVALLVARWAAWRFWPRLRFRVWPRKFNRS